MNEDGIPLRIVFDKSLDIRKVIKTPKTITAVNNKADSRELAAPPFTPMKNIVIIAISVGNLPLQGTKLFNLLL